MQNAHQLRTQPSRQDERLCCQCSKPVLVAEAVAIEGRFRTLRHYHYRCWYQQGKHSRASTYVPRWRR